MNLSGSPLGDPSLPPTTPSPGLRTRVKSPEVARLVREARGLLVKELASVIGRSSSYVSKVESGALGLSGAALNEYARALDVSPALLTTECHPQPVEGAHFLSQSGTPARIRKQAIAQANWACLLLRRLLDLGEYDHSRAIPHVDPDVVDGGAAVADIVRRSWRLTGPIEDMTGLLESAGVFVLTPARVHPLGVDALTLRAENVTAVVLADQNLSPERRRWTLAHELGHLVMDKDSILARRWLEERADAFAAELLAPFAKLEHELRGITPSDLGCLEEQRRYWGISVPELVRIAYRGGCISEQQYRYWFRVLNAQVRSHAVAENVECVETPRVASLLLQSLRAEGHSMGQIVQHTWTDVADLEGALGELGFDPH